jgi:Tfp pilus assembly protein PilV
VIRKGNKMATVCKHPRRERGTSLIEMMIAILVLSVGLIGSVVLASVAMNGDVRSRKDSTSAAVAEMVIGQISATPVGGSVSSVTVTDCAGNSNSVSTSGTTTGAGANLTSRGGVDYSQSFSSVTSGYAMMYTVCGVNSGAAATYDVRWNVTKLASGKAEYVVAAAQSVNANTGSALVNMPAVNLRTVVGNDGN